MKITRKGFTLVELLIVMGIMGILGAMGMIGGQQASDAARATTIADNMEKAAAAMQAYYIDNSAAINVDGTTAEKVADGASAYLSETLIDAVTIGNLKAGQYGVVLTVEKGTDGAADANWFLVYKLVANEAADGRKVKAVLASRADKMNFKQSASTTAAAYDGTTGDATDTIYMFVR